MKLTRRYSLRAHAAKCREPGCPFTRNGPDAEDEAAAHAAEKGHCTETVRAAVVLHERAG